MHIALVKRKCSLRVGGSERYCVLLARGLMDAGHRVTVIGESIDEQLNSEIDFKAVSILKLTSSTKNHSFALNTSRAISAGSYDIAYGLGRAFGVDAIRVTERIQSHWLGVNYPNSAWLQKWNPRHRTLIGLERKIYQSQSTKVIVAQSQLDRGILIHNYGIDPNKIHVVPNGVDKTDFRFNKDKDIRSELSIPQNAKLLLFVGNDFAGKGLDTVIKAVAKCDNHPINLIVAGSDSQKAFRKLAAEQGIVNRVHFVGRRSDMASLYSAADISILPTKYEPFPNVVLESLSCSTPVITTPHSGAEELIEENRNGYLIQKNDSINELSHKLDRYFTQSEFDQQAMQGYARETVDGYSLEKNIQRTESLLNQVFEQKAVSRLGAA